MSLQAIKMDTQQKLDQRQYWNLQDQKDKAEVRFAAAITSIKDLINSSKKQAESFFSVAQEDGARDILMSGSAIASANENFLISNLTPTEAVGVFQVIGALQQQEQPPADIPAKLLLLGQLIAIGHQLSSLPESPHSAKSSFDLQVQRDGSIVVEEFPLEEEPAE